MSISTPILSNQNGNLNINSIGQNNIIFNTNTDERLRITANGNIGIGVNIPVANLDMGTGTIKTSILSNNTNLILNTSGSGDLIFRTSGTEKFRITSGGVINTNNNTIEGGSGEIKCGTLTSLTSISTPSISTTNNLNINYSTTGNVTFGNNTGNNVIINSTGFVGIGSLIPTARVDVGTGAIKARTLTNNGNLTIETIGQNIFFNINNIEKLRLSSTDRITTNDNSIDVGTGNLAGASVTTSLLSNSSIYSSICII